MRNVARIPVFVSVLLAWLAIRGVGTAGGHVQSDNNQSFITGSPEAIAILGRVRASLHLEDVRSLLVEGMIAAPDTALMAGTIDPRGYRFLLPDMFQERSRLFSRDYVFSFSPEYWQSPPPDDLAVSRRNKLRELTDWSVLMLERAPSQFPLTVSLGRNTSSGSAMLIFSNPDAYTRRVTYDGTEWRPIAIEYDRLDNNRREQVFSLTVKSYATVAGHIIPQVIDQTFTAGGAASTIEFANIQVNIGVTANDFRER